MNKKIKGITIILFVGATFVFLPYLTVNGKQDDNEGKTFDFAPYLYSISTSFTNTQIPEGQYVIIPSMELNSHFTVDQAFQDYFDAWWRSGHRYVHEIEERIISGSSTHYFDYDGDYMTDISDTIVDYEMEDDPEWELHVYNPVDNLIPELDYFVISYWVGFGALPVGTYRNSHWLTSEVDGFGFGFMDYDHLLRQEFTLEITGEGGGPMITGIQSEVRSIPLAFRKSVQLSTLEHEAVNLNLEVRQISDTAFKLVSEPRFTSAKDRNTFNKWSYSLLEEKYAKDQNAYTNALISFKQPINIA